MSINFNVNIQKQALCFKGKYYTKQQLEDLKIDLQVAADSQTSQTELYSFLINWFNDSDSIEVFTSGSTGKAKSFLAKKQHMLASAIRTCTFLKLKPGDSALLCMPLNFIGAKMMVVRALVAGLDLHHVTPSLNPMRDIAFAPDFVAMTPQQVATSLYHTEEKLYLQQVKHLLLGGMAVLPSLEDKLKLFPNNVWLGYGMTETLSHIALRKLNGIDASKYFTPLNQVSVSLSDNQTLVIHDTKTNSQPLTTNDLAQIYSDGRFEILGRIDNVVNSGGIKIQIEEIEEKLSNTIDIAFQISSVAHHELGEQLVLCTEKPCHNWRILCSKLHKHKVPKVHIILPKLPLTGNGKPDRIKTRELVHDFYFQKQLIDEKKN